MTTCTRQVHVDRTSGVEACERSAQHLRHGRGVAQIERACRHQARTVTVRAVPDPGMLTVGATWVRV